MVLDQQVQPLTRVWCLFEFLLASERQHDLVFATDLGVLGDQGASPDIALQVGRALRTLQVVNCHASVEEDRQKIFQFIRSKMGSLANMDIQIKQRMSRILQRLGTSDIHARKLSRCIA
ncbi:pmpB [Symbiodinium pilosum]|uniref:PmpB protein n=1 Tax=Symbiodinium pilosum TaxID=2952 RepID=A0A812QFB2_SYMPI|nr:pmpB [Symbiodinium pilosum]